MVPPRPQIIPVKPQPEPQAPQPKEKKQKRLNPKNDPNCAFCFKCQEYHHKNLHKEQALHIIHLQRGSKAPTNIKTISSQSSRPTTEQIQQEKAAIGRFLGKRQPQYQTFRDRQAEEEDELDNFDYSDGFIDDDDEGQDYRKHLRKLTGYDPSAYDDADFDDRDMEVRNFEVLEREDHRSKLIGTPR